MQNAKPITRNISVISIISLYENVQKYYITHINPITPIIPQKSMPPLKATYFSFISRFYKLERPLDYGVSILAAPHILNLNCEFAILARGCADRGEGVKDYGVGVAKTECVLN